MVDPTVIGHKRIMEKQGLVWPELALIRMI